VKGKEESKRNDERARGTQVPSGRRIAVGGNLIKFDNRRPHTEGVQIIHFVEEKHREI
jgi:hypothetical protein